MRLSFLNFKQSDNLWFKRARYLQSHARVYIARRRRNFLIDRRSRARVIFLKMQLLWMTKIMNHWRRIRGARVLGIRLKYSVYHVWLLEHTFYEWHSQWYV